MTPEELDQIQARAESVASVAGNGDAMGSRFRDKAFNLAEHDVPALLALVRELESKLTEAKARAYDKGYTLGRKDGSDWRIHLGGTQGLDRRNPYRAALTATEEA